MKPIRRIRAALVLTLVAVTVPLVHSASPAPPSPTGYYRMPALHGETLVFVSEGDLWKVKISGGAATRLTSHPGEESNPAISADGTMLAFTGSYEGPAEVYTMPVAGGLPQRWTWDSADAFVRGWTGDGKVLFATRAHSTLPNQQLLTVDPRDGVTRMLPLAQASDGVWDPDGKTLYFTRLPFQGSHTRRYQGGTAQSIWAWTEGSEAKPLTGDWKGTSRTPMWWKGRLYFASDRDGSMNLWSMKPDGSDARQHTHHREFDVASPSLSEGRIAYQLGADLRVLDLGSGADASVPITIDSDLDQTREHWVAKPIDYVTDAHLSPNGDRVALTARGRLFVAPARQGRLVEVTHRQGVRCREARFMPSGGAVVALSDASGEVEVWTMPANGVGPSQQLTKDADVLRWDAVPSPDGHRVAHYDKNQRLWIYDIDKKSDRKIDESPIGDFADLSWSPDGRWLAYVAPAANLYQQIWIYDAEGGTKTAATTDRYDSYSPAWSPDGKWLYLLSDRNIRSFVRSVWGSYQPEPFFDRRTKIYQIALKEGARSPFAARDELHPEEADEKEKKGEDKKGEAKSETKDEGAAAQGKQEKTEKPKVAVSIDLKGLAERILEVPIPAGNYASLMITDKALFWLSEETVADARPSLVAATITRDKVDTKTIVEGIRAAEMSLDGKKILIRKGDSFYVLPANVEKADLDKKDVDLSGWALSLTPREEWRQMFVEAWRLERDYFYDPGMHGLNWKEIRAKYEPLVDRVRGRSELSDLLAQMVSELSALHIFVRGGDLRAGPDDINVASLGADLDREPKGGWRVGRVYRADPDDPSRLSPLARQGVQVVEGDLIEAIDGVELDGSTDPGSLLRKKAGRQVLLHVRPAKGEERDVIVTPMTPAEAASLRYDDWEYTRRLKVDELGAGQIGYVHLRAMNADNIAEWARNYYPVFDRQGLVIDVRHNRGGNIDSWILGRLLRKAWFYWSQRVGRAPVWNMQYAFRGHVAVLCNEGTSSDGEAFSEGIKRLGIGKVFGTRTWGGEIWLSSNNFLVDRGIATAAETGVYGPEGQWLIEGHGVDPDVVVDNLPVATFKGGDAQLEAAVAWLKEKIRSEPVEVVPYPKYPNKTLQPKK